MPNEPVSSGPHEGGVQGSERNSASVVHEEMIQGGSISDLDQEVNWRPEKHHAETASKLAVLLVWVLIVTIGVHYVAVAWLSVLGISQAITGLESAFDKTLPVLSSFVGGAVTYYFTKGQKQ